MPIVDPHPSQPRFVLYTHNVFTKQNTVFWPARKLLSHPASLRSSPVRVATTVCPVKTLIPYCALTPWALSTHWIESSTLAHTIFALLINSTATATALHSIQYHTTPHSQSLYNTHTMSTMLISTYPSTNLSWADDDDDFDFEAWKATADISAPSIESLPPLQLPVSDCEFPFTFSVPTNEIAPWAAPEPVLDSRPTPKDMSEVDWRCGKAMLTWRALQDAPEPPAYPEMTDGWETKIRVNYSGNWSRMKVDGGWDCRFPVMFRASRLREVDVVESIDPASVEVKEFENPPAAQAVDLALNPAETTSCLSSSDCATPEIRRITDEGYYSEESPPLSPTLSTTHNHFEASFSTTQIGLSTAASFIWKGPNHQRKDSQDALEENRKSYGSMIEVVEATGTLPTWYFDNASLDVGNMDEHPGISNHLSGAATKSWSYASQVDWKTVIIITAGIVLGGAMHLTKRR
jgi:hypothetical protein